MFPSLQINYQIDKIDNEFSAILISEILSSELLNLVGLGLGSWFRRF